MTYSEKLLDPRWQKLRLQVFERDNWKCVRCSATPKSLHIHHVGYIFGRDPWDYDISLLETICDKCHGAEHGIVEPKEMQFESKYSHLIPTRTDSTLDIYNEHITTLMWSLSREGNTSDLDTEIQKNIMYLQQKRKEYING